MEPTTAVQKAIAANRAALAGRIVEQVLRRATEQHVALAKAELVHFFDNMRDSERFLVWRSARAARCPSAETWRVVRGLLMERLSTEERLATAGACGMSVGDEWDLREEPPPDDVAAIATYDASTWSEP